jgi:hypothetical protein
VKSSGALPALSQEASCFVFEGDRAHVDAFNATRGVPPAYRLHTELIPEPVLGSRDAPVLVLARNPTWGPDDVELHQRHGPYRDALLANAGSDPAGHVMPHLVPDPIFRNTHSGGWWQPRTDGLGAQAGVDLSRSICAVEFHGYHSSQYRTLPITLPSQRHGFGVVTAAIERGAVIVLTRAMDDWCIAVPELRSYKQLVKMRSQTIWFSKNNLEPGGFERIVEALRRQ